MKIGIITIQDNLNYGNRLQNYAVSEILKSYGMETDTIFINNDEDNFKYITSKLKRQIRKNIPSRFLYMNINFKRRLYGGKLENTRAKEFRTFNKRYISVQTYYVNRLEQLSQKKEIQEYDYFFAGSDQIWNPYFAMDEKYFLTFAPPEKRIAFIASIGVEQIPSEQAKRCAKWLKQMHYISVREESAVQIVKELTGRDADCFFDPVLLLGREEWLKIEEPVPFSIPSHYILSFFLGREPGEEIKVFADGRNMDVIHMNQKEYEKYYSLNPAQFLYLIHHAQYILTDSFHVTAFSIIFEKQFSVFRRREEGMENMFSRMETLLGRLGLMKRVQDASAMGDLTPISRKQYQDIEKILLDERVRLDRKMEKILKSNM